MIVNKSLQYAMLLVLYLCRAGRARLQDISLGLNLSLALMRVVAAKLRMGRVIKSVRGPGGGYEINGDPSVRDVFEAISPVLLLPNREMTAYARGQAEHRALHQLIGNLHSSLWVVLKRKVRALSNELVVNEMAALNRPSTSTAVN